MGCRRHLLLCPDETFHYPVGSADTYLLQYTIIYGIYYPLYLRRLRYILLYIQTRDHDLLIADPADVVGKQPFLQFLLFEERLHRITDIEDA